MRLEFVWRWALVGVVFWIVGAIVVTRILLGLLYEVRPTDPLVIGAVSLLLTGVALLGCYIPARVDPLVVLRDE